MVGYRDASATAHAQATISWGRINPARVSVCGSVRRMYQYDVETMAVISLHSSAITHHDQSTLTVQRDERLRHARWSSVVDR